MSGLDNLEKLADYLDTVPPEQFDYDTWGETTACGTVACALGHAVLGPFKDWGFKLAKDYSFFEGGVHEVVRLHFVTDDDKETTVGSTFVIHMLFGDPDETGDPRDAEDFYYNKKLNDLFYSVDGKPTHDPTFAAERIREYVRNNR